MGGLWNGLRVEDLATSDALARNPGLVLDFYNTRRQQIAKAHPNAAHVALARPQFATKHKVIVATQNIDDLHERAGSSKVSHIHGSIFEAKCNACWRSWSASYDLDPEDTCPHCDEPAVRPNIVLFGEAPKETRMIEQAIKKADLFVAIGTSGTVHPAADWVRQAKVSGVRTLEINTAKTIVSEFFDETLRGAASEVVPRWVASMIG